MKFFKLSAEAFRCTISAEELSGYDITLDDILKDQNKAQILLYFILQEAKERLGVTMSRAALAVRVEVQQGGDLALVVFSGEEELKRQLYEQLRESLNLGEDLLKDLKPEQLFSDKPKERSKEDLASLLSGLSLLAEAAKAKRTGQPMPKHGTSEKKAKTDSDSVEIDLSAKAPGPGEIAIERMSRRMVDENEDLSQALVRPLWAEFDSIDQAVRMADQLPTCDDVESAFYLLDHIYYLRMDFHEDREVLMDALLPVAEYSTMMYADYPGMTSIAERGSCLLPEYALRTLRAMNFIGA